MPQYHVIGLVMATMLEAKPFVLELGLSKLKTGPFPVFGNGGIVLIISGIGKTNAAMACSHLIHGSDPALLCNLGAAGATNTGFDLGACCQIDKVVEPDRPDLETGRPCELYPDLLEGFSSVVLATQDKPVLDLKEREKISLVAQLVDMEGASVGQTSRRYGKRCYMFKFVSDTPAHDQSSSIRSNISRYRDVFSGFFIREVLPRLD